MSCLSQIVCKTRQFRKGFLDMKEASNSRLSRRVLGRQWLALRILRGQDFSIVSIGDVWM